MQLTPDQQRNVLRQLIEVQALAERFNKGVEDFSVEVEAFSQFSQELKVYLLARIESDMVLERLAKIEVIKFRRPKWSILYFVFLPGWAAYGLANHIEKVKCQDKIREIASIYSSIHFLLKAEWS